jgi:hypothetical protein
METLLDFGAPIPVDAFSPERIAQWTLLMIRLNSMCIVH